MKAISLTACGASPKPTALAQFKEVWSEHFQWTEDGLRIVGRTPTGRATVAALHLSDDPDAMEVRSYWVMAGWHPPED